MAASASVVHFGRSGRNGNGGRPLLLIILLAATLALIGIGAADVSAAEDEHPADAQRPSSDIQQDPLAPRSGAGTRVYAPLHPADPAQIDKQFAIGHGGPLVGRPSDEFTRSVGQDHDRNAAAADGDLSRTQSAASSPSRDDAAR